MFYEQERFTLITDTKKLVLQNDPVNWKEVETTLARSKRSDGIFLEIKQNLDFVKDGYTFLNLERLQKGTNAKVQLMRESFYNGCWNLQNIGYLDFKTAKWDRLTFTADYYEDTFSQKFKNNLKEKFEVDRIQSIDGEDLPIFTPNVINLPGRQLFLQSRLNDNGEQSKINIDAPSDLRVRAAVPLNNVFNSDRLVSQFVSGASFDSVDASAANFFILDDTQERTRRVKISGTFTIDRYFADDLETENLQLTLSKYDTDYTDILDVWTEENYLYNTSNPASDVGNTIAVSFDQDVTLAPSESLYLGWRFNNNESGGGAGDTDFELDVSYDITVDIDEESYFEPTSNKVVTLQQLGQRLVSIIDAEAIFESDLIAESWPDVTLASGETVRNVLFSDENEQLQPAPLLTTSFDDFYKFMFTLEPCGFDVILREGQKVVKLEKIDYFLNNSDIINLGNVTDIQYETDLQYLFGSVKVGYTKSGVNEEVYGLEVTHTVNGFTTPLDVDNEYNATCAYITDPNEQELTRRKQYEILPDTDSQYDKDVMVFDSKETKQGFYTIKTISEQFTTVGGVFSAETLYNTIFSPINCLLRHGKWFKNDLGLSIYNDELLRYANTKGNVSLFSQQVGEELRKENDNIPLTDFDNPIINPITITLTASYSRSLENKLRSIPAGKRNAYCLMKFTDENGQIGYGYLYKADIKDTIKVELKQAFGF